MCDRKRRKNCRENERGGRKAARKKAVQANIHSGGKGMDSGAGERESGGRSGEE